MSTLANNSSSASTLTSASLEPDSPEWKDRGPTADSDWGVFSVQASKKNRPGNRSVWPGAGLIG